MRKLILILFLTSIAGLLSCDKNSNRHSDLEFTDGKRKIKLSLLSNKKFVEINKPTLFKLSYTNIDSKTIMTLGQINKKEHDKLSNETFFEINANENTNLIENKIPIKIYESKNDSAVLLYTFLIPLNQKQ